MAQLLEALFTSTDEVSAFLRVFPDGRSLVNSLPNPDVPMREYCLAAGDQLDAQGRVTQSLFARLLVERPGREDEIRAAEEAIELQIEGQTDDNRPPVLPRDKSPRRTLWIVAAVAAILAVGATTALVMVIPRGCQVAELPEAELRSYNDLLTAADIEAGAGNWCAAHDLLTEAIQTCDGDRAVRRRARELEAQCR